MKKAGKLNIPDNSNGPKTIVQPVGCHCHCAIPIVNAWHESGLKEYGVTLELPKHTHPGKGGWWKNDDCSICNS